MTPKRLLALILVIVLASGGYYWWKRHPPGGAADGEIALEWKGRFRGTMSLPARVSWCPVTRTGVIEAIARDTGVILVLYERDSLTDGQHTVINPVAASTGPRPVATLAIRWAPDSTVLAAFTSLTGSVTLTRAAGTMSGTLSVKLNRDMPPTDTLVVTGAFKHLPVLATAVGCT